MLTSRALLITLAALWATPHTSAAQARDVAFVDVNVVTMDSPSTVLRQDVIVRDGRIVEIGKHGGVVIPRGATRIEGQGTRWLMPGLVDMHVHVFDRREFIAYLANGITTVRNLHGLPVHLAWRDSLAAGLIIGPRLYTAGAILDGDPPTRGTNTVVRTAAEATAEVERQADAGFDLIKVYDNIGVEAYHAVVEAARRRGLPVAGHVPTPVTLDGVLAARQRTIEHVEELLPLFGDGRVALAVDSIAKAIAASGTAVTPTMVVYASALDQVIDWDGVQRRPVMRFLNPATRTQWGWDPTGASRSGNAQARVRFERVLRFFLTDLVPALHRANVMLLAGSDAPIPALVPGFALHDELELLRRAGLTPVEVLRTATANPAAVLGVAARRGRVARGFDADLLLLEADPTVDIGALQARVGVMVGGRWHPQAELLSALEASASQR